MTRDSGRYAVELTSADGRTVSKIMSWTQVRRYLPGGSNYGEAVHVSLHRIVGEGK